MKIEHIDDWKSDVLRGEKSLWHVFKASVWVVGKFQDFRFCAIIFFAAVSLVLIGRIALGQFCHPGLSAKIIHDWAVLGIGYSTSILGFLIAGFSIFATMTKPELFHVLAKFRANGRKISQFKFIFYNFLVIFVHYMAFLGVTAMIAFLYVADSPLWYAANVARSYAPPAIDTAINMSGAFLFAYSIYIILLLKGFVWNLYQAMLFAIFTEAK